MVEFKGEAKTFPAHVPNKDAKEITFKSEVVCKLFVLLQETPK